MTHIEKLVIIGLSVLSLGFLGHIFGGPPQSQATAPVAAQAVPDQPLQATPRPVRVQVMPPAPTPTACVIKGNISSSGERIYHVPGQRYYDKTLINGLQGERWFCTEQEAIAAGWRKAKV